MSTIYFTNTASSGDGSLRQALGDAAEGDVVAPDPSVFPAGTTVEIELASRLEVRTALTLDADATRIRLRHVNAAAGNVFYAYPSASYFRAVGVDFIGRVVAYASECTFRRCLFAGNAATGMGIGCSSNTQALNLYDCVVVGVKNAAIQASSPATFVTITRSTIAGNAASLNVYNAPTVVDSIVDPVCSTVGFLAAPPDVIATSSDALPWENWNLRLLPSSSYASGATSAEGEVDLDGKVRGRTVGTSPTTYAVGAYERTDDVAAVYWQRTASPSFREPTDWAYEAAKTSVVSSFDRPACFVLDAPATTLDDAPPESSFVVVEPGADAAFNAGAVVASLALQRGATVSVAEGFALVAVAFYGVDATVDAPGRAYFATASSVDAITVGANVVACEYGADVSFVKATETGVYWSAKDSSVSVLVETQTDGAWTTLAQTAGTHVAASLVKGDPVRVFDGAKFLTVATSFLHAWLEYTQAVAAALASVKKYETVAQTVPRYKITKGYIMASQYYNRGEAPVFFARIEDSETSAIVPKSAVSSISYTAYRVTNSWSTEKRTPVEGHENVAVDLAAYLDALVTDDPRWTQDSVGYNFIFEPDVAEKPIFPDAGNYVVVVTIQFEGANPAPISYEVTVS